jgi:hypothetical protein
MNIVTPNFFRTLSRYRTALRTVHEEIRTERLINELSPRLRKDIGWPDAYAERRARRI